MSETLSTSQKSSSLSPIMQLEEIHLSSCIGSAGSTSPPLPRSGPQGRFKMVRSSAPGDQGWQARLMLREDVTRRMARRILVDVHGCMHTFESKKGMVEATRKTSRIARNHHCSSH